jgi:hypothetical protein
LSRPRSGRSGRSHQRRRVQPFRHPNHPEPRWTPEDATRVHSTFVDWLNTSHGISATQLAYYLAYAGGWPPELATEQARLGIARSTAGHTADVLGAATPIWCDPPMVDLLAAAADTYPAMPFQQADVPAPDGMVIFAKPLPAVWYDTAGEPTLTDSISAITWGTGRQPDGTATIGIAAWARHTGTLRHREPDVAVCYAGLRLISYAAGRYGDPHAHPDGPAGPNRILQTLNALCRSRLVRDSNTDPATRPAARATGHRRPAEPLLRRLYLRRPEDGPAELDAVRAARRGERARGHWVRGHRKNQWYASIGEHRTTWIDGYPRGDFTRGHVPGKAILVARAGPRP